MNSKTIYNSVPITNQMENEAERHFSSGKIAIIKVLPPEDETFKAEQTKPDGVKELNFLSDKQD